MLQHKGTINIETERLILRPFAHGDAENMFSNWANDKEICRYMRWQPHATVEETAGVINSWIDSYSSNHFYIWAITQKEQDEPIGSISLFTKNELDLCGDVGYCIAQRYWGQGLATEALQAVLGFAFMEVGYNRIETYHSIHNPASGKVMEKAGMQFEGMARQKYKSIMGFEDSNMYAILKDDFINR